TAADGSRLVSPTCDTTPGNNNGAADDPDGLAADGCDVVPGGEVTYTVTVSSIGTTDAHDVTTVETVPVGITPLSIAGGAPVTTTGDTITGASGSVGVWDETARTITWLTAGPLAPGTTATLDWNATLDASDSLTRGQDFTTQIDVDTYFALTGADRSQITTDNPANADIITYGNGTTATRGVVTPDINTIEVHFPELDIVTVPASGQDITDVLLNQPFTWEITVTNIDATASAYNVDVVDVLPEGWTFDPGSVAIVTPFGPATTDPGCAADVGVCADPSALNIETLTWTDLVSGPTEPLGPGETITISFTATPQAAALTSTPAIGDAHTGYDGGAGPVHTNQASTSGEDASGSPSCCDPDGAGVAPAEFYTDTDSTDVWIARADIEVDKTITPIETDADPNNGPYWFGAWAYYTVTVTNVGPDAATGVDVAEILDPVGLEFDSVDSIDAGTFDNTTNIWTVGDMANADSFQLVLRTRLVEVGPVTNIAQNAAADQYDSDSTPNNSVATEDDQASVTIEVVPTSLGDYVWLDLNADGVQDPGEPGIPGVMLDLTWLDPATGAPQTFTVTTAADGSYGVPAAANLPTFTDITVTVDPASANLLGLAPSFDRDGTADGVATDQVTPADTILPDGSFADLAFDFGYTPDGAQLLGDTIWWDQDNSADATNGVGEVAMSGITVTATWAGWDGTIGTADDLDFTRVTGALGDYLFDDIPPGQYEVSVTTTDLPAGLDTPTFDLDGVASASTTTLTVNPTDALLDVDFSYRGIGQLGDTVWFDHNANGVVDASEPGLGDVDVTASWSGPDGITGTTDDLAFTITTDPDGAWLFENMPHGEYVITVDPASLPTGMVPTFDQDGIGTPNVSIATLATGAETDLDQDFGYRGAGTIGDTVFFDVDGVEADGGLDAGDAPIVGATVTVVWDGADGVAGTGDDFTYNATTIVGGAYSVTDLPHGNYTVTVDPASLPAGLMTPTFDPDGIATANTSATRLTSTAPDDLAQDFAYTGSGVGQIGDTIYFDQNNDGIQDVGEVGFTGVTVNLTWFGPDGALGGTDDVIQTTTTGVDGAYLFDNLPDGNFLVAVDDTTLPTGLTPSADFDGIGSPNESLVSLDATTPSSFDQDFGYAGVGSLGDVVWLDVDNSGTNTIDTGEIGIPGVALTVVWTNPQGDDVTFATTTGADGTYLIPHLPHGTYNIAVDPLTLPGGISQTYDVDGLATPDTSAVLVDALNPDNLDQDFSYAGVGSLGDTVWFDQNADGGTDPVGSGIFDDQDQPLAGVDVVVTWSGFDGVAEDDPATPGIDEGADDLVHIATTNAAGEWTVANLPHGDYTVAVDTATLPAGIVVPTHDMDGLTTPDMSSVTLDALLTDDPTHDFSYTGAGQVGSIVWFDLNGDAVIDPLDVPLAGVTLNIEFVGPEGAIVTDSTVSGIDGSYQFVNLPFDTPITITVDNTTLPAGFVPVWDADDAVLTPHVSVATLSDSAPIDPNQNFAYNGTGSIGDTIWYDRDNSATDTVDATDVVIPGVGVTVTWSNPTGAADLTTFTSTDAAGMYLFENLPHGDYTVTVEPSTLPGGVIPTFDGDGTLTVDTSIVPLDDVLNVQLDQDFAYTGTGSIGDTIWRDENGDGIVDTDELPIEGVVLNLNYVDPITGIVMADTTTSDALGNYIFDHLPAGDYTITIDPASLPAGFVPTHDPDGTDSIHVASLTLAPGTAQKDVDFGYRPEADLSIDISHVGDVEVGAENIFTATIHNDGPAASGPVMVTTVLPPGVSLVASPSPDWSCVEVSGGVQCTLINPVTGVPADIPAGETLAFDLAVDVAPHAAPEITIDAIVFSEIVDPNPDNDTASDTAATPLSVLTVETTLNDDLVAGGDATYTIDVANLGADSTRGPVVVQFELPPGMTLDSASSEAAGVTCNIDGSSSLSAAASPSSTLVTCTNPTQFAPGEGWSIDLKVDVASSAGGQNLTTTTTISGGNLVNGAQLPPATMDAIYADLQDPDSLLGANLGLDPAVAAINIVVDSAPVEIVQPLAFTGATVLSLIGIGIGLILIGAVALWFADDRRRLLG
ncbi:MAG: hypothetical protein HKN94_05650, partial [Acidimicrobiales bacterium]|nr:hypothetical protein [Acidimicrobiales bacterium]